MNVPNPKKAYGDKKPPLHLLPLAGMIHQSLAHLDGNYKYTFENWNTDPVEKLTYIGAILRHVELYKYGENFARDTGVHNLGGVMACCAILLDAELNGKLIDNTRHSQAACDLLHTAEYIVERLKDAQKEREAAKLKADNPLYTVTQGPLIDDAGGDAPADEVFLKCKDCKEPLQCIRMWVCFKGKPAAVEQRNTFDECGRCATDTECVNRGYCLQGK